MMDNHKIFERIQNLHDNPTLAESIDTNLYWISIAAGKKCQKFREPGWSVKLHEAQTRVDILKQVLSICGTRYNQYSQIEELQLKQGTLFLIPTTFEECKLALHNAQVEVSQIARNSSQHREDENISKVAALELKGNTNRAKILRNIFLKKLFAKIQYLCTPERNTGISSIQVPAHPTKNPKDCKEWITIDAPKAVVEKLQDRNRSHFSQAQGTPFTVPPLSEDLNFDGTTSSAEMIIDGTYDSSGLADITHLVISNLRKSKYAIRAPLTMTISDAAYTSKIKNWKESTSTSPSGLHLGHYHAMVARHD
jgi:hypothetical protein